MPWKITYNGVDCGVFVMRNMETYVGRGIFLKELEKEDAELLKAAEAHTKKQAKSSNILTNVDVKMDQDLMKRFNEKLLKTIE
ncbi:hypothetical protein Tco_1574479 [Tanacetum coccineum]